MTAVLFCGIPHLRCGCGTVVWDRLLALVGEEDPVVVEFAAGSGFEALQQIFYGKPGALFASYVQDDIAVGH